MSINLSTTVGSLCLKNPVIAASGEHMIDEAGIRSAILAGAGAVVVKSTNESEAAKDQLTRAEYTALGADWEPVEWGAAAPREATLVTRSGLTPLPFDVWLEQNARMDRLARQHDCHLIPSLILADLDQALKMAGHIEAAGFRSLEFNVGTPYASQAAKGAVSTELSPARIGEISAALSKAISIPFWIKVTGQSERVPELAGAAFDNGAQSVVMAGRLLGLVPDLDTQAPVLGTSCGIGGFWNLPLTCHWLALTRRQLGPEKNLIGINGAQNGRDVARMMLAGASAVGLSSAVMMRGFQLISDSIAELKAYCREKRMDAASLVGVAADRRLAFADMPQLDNHWRKFVPAPRPDNQ